jgi:hypothetical protein
VRRFSSHHQRTCSSQHYNRSDPETVIKVRFHSVADPQLGPLRLAGRPRGASAGELGRVAGRVVWREPDRQLRTDLPVEWWPGPPQPYRIGVASLFSVLANFAPLGTDPDACTATAVRSHVPIVEPLTGTPQVKVAACARPSRKTRLVRVPAGVPYPGHRTDACRLLPQRQVERSSQDPVFADARDRQQSDRDRDPPQPPPCGRPAGVGVQNRAIGAAVAD